MNNDLLIIRFYLQTKQRSKTWDIINSHENISICIDLNLHLQDYILLDNSKLYYIFSLIRKIGLYEIHKVKKQDTNNDYL